LIRAIAAASGIVCATLLSIGARAESRWNLEQVASRLTHLSGIWGISAQDVFAVGNRGVILHFDGARWTRQQSGTGKDLAAVWVASRNEAFAVGLDGVILHFDGHGWRTEKSGTSKTLLDVWGATPTDVYAVGRGGTILHFDGRSWTRRPSPTRYDLAAVWGSSATDVYAAGDHGTILHFDGTNWTQKVPSFGWRCAFSALGGTSASDVYAAGWRRPSGQLGGEREGFLLRYDGETWNPVGGGDAQIVLDLWAVARDEVYLAGAALNGLEKIRRFDGADFRVVDSEIRFSPRSIWGAPTGELFVGGTNGFVLTGSAR
jgi:hypothetical protein